MTQLSKLKSLQLDDTKSQVPALNTLLKEMGTNKILSSLTKLTVKHTFLGHDPFDCLTDAIKQNQFPNLKDLSINCQYHH
jgi:hypothetical protein